MLGSWRDQNGRRDFRVWDAARVIGEPACFALGSLAEEITGYWKESV